MKYLIKSRLAILLLVCGAVACKTQSTEWSSYYVSPTPVYYKKLPKKIRKELDKEFILVNGGTYSSGQIVGNDTFSDLLSERRVTISSVYTCKYEVTVGDFMKFYHATGDTLNKPDTLCFRKDFPNTLSELMVQVYFWHAKYKNYPVCGVTLSQAQRYCQWKADEINSRITAIDTAIKVRVGFRLPTMFETEYFITYTKDIWGGSKIYIKNLQTINTGDVYDENNIIVKSQYDDKYGYTAPVNAYKPDELGLFNIQGNVAEMTLGRIPDLKDVYISDYRTDTRWPQDLELRLDSLQSLCRYYEEILPPAELLFYTPYLKMKRMKEVLSDSTYYITKGGSFAHSRYYAQSGAFIPVRENESHSWLGFRLIMNIYTEE